MEGIWRLVAVYLFITDYNDIEYIFQYAGMKDFFYCAE